MRWIKVCGVGAGALVLGVLILYLGPFYQLGPISSLLDVRPIYLLPGGALVVLVGVAAVVVSFARSPAGSTAGGGRALFADIAAPIGLPIAATAILTFLSTYLASNLLFAGPGPCDYSTTPECFGAHPDYCQPINGGYGWSTPGSRLSTLLLPLSLAAWPAALAGALISLIALAMGTARRRIAIAGLMVGSLLVVVIVLGLLSLWFFGGGD